MRKTILEKRLARLNSKVEKLTARADASTDVNEVRAINEQLVEIREEIQDVKDEIAAIDAESRNTEPVTAGTAVPASAQMVNGATRTVGTFTNGETRTENMLESMEYRTAFKAFVQNGTPIPAELRAGEAISTTDTQAAIPFTVVNEIINTVRKRYGNLYNKVRKTNVQGGIEYPVGSLKASFKWINESTVSPRQKLDPLAKVMFAAHTAEIRVAQTFLSSILTISDFETKIAEVIAIAYLQAMDEAIVNGTGNGMPLGILNDPRVAATGNVVTMNAADFSDWKKWRKNFFAKLPLGYRSGEFIFPLSTVESYLETMSDEVGQPVFRQATGLEVNDGDAVNPNGRFFGREVALVEPDIISDFDSAASGDVIGVFWQPDEYAINENFGFTMRRYFDEETNEWVDKALVVVDGKTLNPEGFWLIKKA